MEINFNTDFKDFLNNSQVYKNILNYIKDENTRKNGDQSLLKMKLKATQAVVECLVINYDKIHNLHFSREHLSSLINENNSQEAQRFSKKNKDISQHTQWVVYLYFTEENKELTHLLEEIHAVIPDESIKIDFNKNFKGFIDQSQVCKKLETAAKNKIDFNKSPIEEQYFSEKLIRLVLECIINNYNVLNTTSFFNLYPSSENKKLYSTETRKFIKDDEKIDYSSKYMKSVMVLELMYEPSIYTDLVEEIKQYECKPVNKVKSKKKM